MGPQECIEYALQNSPTFKSQALEQKAAELNHRIEEVALDPALTFNANRDQEDPVSHSESLNLSKRWHGGWRATGTLQSSDTSESTTSSSRSISISKALLKDGSQLETRRVLDNALVTLLQRNNTLELERRRLVTNVKKQVYRTLRSMETLKIQQLRLDRAKRNLEHAIERDEPMDIATAKLEVPSSEIQLLNAQINIQNNLDNLKVTMGMPLSGNLQLKALTPFDFIAFNLDEDISWSLDNHETLLNQELTIQRQERLLKIAKRDRWPSLRLTAEFSQSSDEGFSSYETDEQSLAMNLSWPIGARSSRLGVDLAKNILERNHLSLKRSQLEKTQRCRQLGRRLEEQQKSILLQAQEVELRELQVEMFQDRWSEGEIDILELVRNQNSLENSRVGLVSAKVNYLETLADYENEVGRPLAR
jgi:outer membrane protein TolC